MTNALTKFVRDDNVQKRIESLLQQRAPQFTTSLITAVNNNYMLQKCDPDTVVGAALTAASMDLPINPNLGFAALVPYKVGRTGKYQCQFQIMWKGFVQLAQRSGRYKTISAVPVYAGQLKSTDPLRGFVWDWSVEAKGAPVGYAAYFELLNGFEKTFYMTRTQADNHGQKYSQSYKADIKNKERKSLWSTDFDSMALKTVVKQLISKFGPMSTSLEQALENDQAVLKGEQRTYIDNDELEAEKATDEEQDAIVAANSAPAEVVHEVVPEAPKAPEPPKKTVKEQVAERGWNKEGKQTKIDTEEPVGDTPS
jgi:recombination protein RecT